MRPLGIEEEMMEKLRVSVYPNPADEMVWVSVAKPEPFEVKILDISGRLVKSFQFSELSLTAPVNLTGLGSGIYTLLITEPNGTASVKLIKK